MFVKKVHDRLEEKSSNLLSDVYKLTSSKKFSTFYYLKSQFAHEADVGISRLVSLLEPRGLY